MSSPASTGSHTPENPIGYGPPGGSGLNVPVAAPVGPAAQPGNIVQYDQKKVPTFFAKPEKDTLTIREWIKRLDSMKNSLGWTEEATYHNAINGLFYPANEIVNVHLHVDIDLHVSQVYTQFL